MRTFAVAGHPVAHSRSPALHEAWYRALGIEARYVRVDVDPAALPPDPGPHLLARFDGLGLGGVNLTVPLKEACLDAVAHLDPAARRAGAINTLVRREDGWHGSNTDLEGFRRAAIEAGADLTGKAVVLGAGGAGRAVAAALLPTAAQVVLLNRSVEKARSVADALGGGLVTGPYDPAPLRDADLIVVAVSGPGRPAIQGLDPQCVPTKAVWMDLNYWDPDPPHQRVLSARGVRCDRGFRMLLHQGALAFEQFCGRVPPLDVGWGVLTQAS